MSSPDLIGRSHLKFRLKFRHYFACILNSAGSVRGFFFEILIWTAQHLTSELLHPFLHKPLLFSLVSGLLEKSAQNSLERYRYGALALRQNSKKSPHDLGALFLLPLARSLILRNSRIPKLNVEF